MNKDAPPSRAKQILFNVLRLGISVGLLGYLLYIADIDKIGRAISSADLRYIALAALIFTAAIFLFALRWFTLLRYAGHHVAYWRLLIYYFIGFFLNTIDFDRF